MSPSIHKPIRIALIGISGYAECHYESILALVPEGVAELVAATVINPSEEVEKCAAMNAMGCRQYSDYKVMLAQEAGGIDLCCIPTGIGWHREMTVAALEAGMHVLVEKPAAATLEEVDLMLEAQKRADRRVFVGFQDMYDDVLWAIKARLVSGQFGTIKQVRLAALWPRSAAYYGRTSWAGKLYTGNVPILDSPANNAMAHFIMMALFLTGGACETAATVSKIESQLYRAQCIESFDTASIRAMLTNDVELIANLSHSADDFMAAELVVETTAGQYTWHSEEGHTLAGDARGRETFARPPGSATRVVMLSHICGCLQGFSDNVCTLSLARSHTSFIENLHQNLEILNVPDRAKKIRLSEGESFTRVPGLSRAIREAHRRGCLLSEVGFPWEPFDSKAMSVGPESSMPSVRSS